MNEKIDLDEIERKMWREANSDGIMELLLGVLLFFTAGTWARSYFTVFLAFVPIFGNRVIEALKARFTYPRIGYVELKEEDGKSLGWGILGYVLVVIAVVSSVAAVFYGGNLESFDAYRWVPLAFGAIFLGGMIYLHGKSGDQVAYLYSFVALVAGGIFTFYGFESSNGFESSKHIIQLYLLSLAGFFLLAGLVRLLTFMRRNPVVDMTDADINTGEAE